MYNDAFDDTLYVDFSFIKHYYDYFLTKSYIVTRFPSHTTL